jgi:hypothetical protein
MPFFSRPNLEDLQFKQTPGSTLSLSGLTRIRTWTGLTISDGLGGDILVTASGATTATTQGHVLTYMDGVISLRPSSASGGTTIFDTHRETTRSGVPNVCVGGDCTTNNFLEGYFFPAVPPSASIGLTNNSREFGDNATGTLSYSAIRNTYQICTVGVDTTGDGGYNQTPVLTPISGDCSGCYTYTFPGACPIPPTGTSQTTESYSMCVVSTDSEVVTDGASISWKNKRYYFLNNILYTVSDASTIETIAQGLSGAQAVLTTSKAATFNLTFNNEFFYYMYPKSFGTPSFIVNGLPNNAWGNSGTGTLFKIDYTNNSGYLDQYYVARSDSRITGSFSIVIS